MFSYMPYIKRGMIFFTRYNLPKKSQRMRLFLADSLCEQNEKNVPFR